MRGQNLLRKPGIRNPPPPRRRSQNGGGGVANPLMMSGLSGSPPPNRHRHCPGSNQKDSVVALLEVQGAGQGHRGAPRTTVAHADGPLHRF